MACKLLSTEDAEIPDSEREPTDGQTHWVLISVQDSGIGIKRDDLKKVFEEFRQIDSGSTRKYGGTGLGMAISRRIVEMHGGHIWLESEEGVGTTFYVTLPHTEEFMSGRGENSQSSVDGNDVISGAKSTERLAASGR